MTMYVPKPYPGGPVSLISADHAFGKGAESPADHGWNALVTVDRMHHYAITTANHYTILNEPYVTDLVKILQRVLHDGAATPTAGA